MSAQILDGQKVAEEVKAEIREELKLLSRKPSLHVILCGNHPPSVVYVRKKVEACAAVGIQSTVHRPFGESITAWFDMDPKYNNEGLARHRLLEVVKQLKRDDFCHGILVQLPLPKFIEPKLVYDAIDPDKDVDVFNPLNVGLLTQGRCRFESCTPGGIIRLVEHYGLSWAGKNVVIINASDIVGKPLAAMLTNREATVTVCHIKTHDLAWHTRHADVVVVGVGIPGFLKPEMVKPGAVVIDVGINSVRKGKVVGDVDPAVAEVAGWLTPVPGGVGPMTVATLLKNTVKASWHLV